MPTVNQEVADAAVAHRALLLRAEASTVRDVLGVYAQAVGVVGARVTAIADRTERNGSIAPADLRRLRILQRDLDVAVRATERTIRAMVGRDLADVATQEAPALVRLLTAALPEEVASLVAVPVLDVATMVATPLGGALWNDRLARDLLAVHDTLQSGLAVSLAQGASVPRAVKALRESGQVVESYRGRAATIVRTEFQRVANEAARQTYLANQDILRGVIHLSTLDTRTCLICGPLHQKRWLYGPDGELLPNPVVGEHRPNPQHPRCRCFDAPWVKSWRDLGVPVTTARDRERLDGKAPERMSYADWLRRQPESLQEERLGPTRYAMWKAGEPLEDFSDAGRLLTIQELSQQ